MRRKRDVFPTPVFPHNTTLYVLAITQSEFSITQLLIALQCVFKRHMFHIFDQTDIHVYRYHLVNEKYSFLESEIKSILFLLNNNFIQVLHVFSTVLLIGDTVNK